MKGNMFTYCLFCETNKTGYISRAVSEMTGCRALCPKQIQHTWAKGGGTRDRVNDLMPGYVFLYYEDKADISLLHSVQGVIRCLSSTAGEYELTGPDEQLAMMLLEKYSIPRNNFSSLFQKYVGTSYSNYINNLRLEQAAKMLKEQPNYTIESVANDCGISSVATLYRLFSKKYGMTPTEYRQTVLISEEQEEDFDDIEN